MVVALLGAENIPTYIRRIIYSKILKIFSGRKISIKIKSRKMGVALSRLSGGLNVSEKFVNNILSQKLLSANTILKKYPKFNFLPKMGVTLPRPSGRPNMPGKFF